MNISSVSFSKIPVNQSNSSKVKIHTFGQDSVSFSGADKKGIPYRFSCKTQDDFHSTMLQVYIRKYLELKSRGLNQDEIISEWFGDTDSTKEQKEEKRDFINKVQEYVDKHDSNFKKVIPLMIPKTYYRGVRASEDELSFRVLSKAQVGDIIQPDMGYAFLTSNKSYAQDYAFNPALQSSPKNSFVMIIKAPVGTPISRDFAFDRSIINSNVVLARGANFEVLDKEVKNGITYITLKYLNCATDRGE